jgi:nucleoside-diphosphate-sugar epimerase
VRADLAEPATYRDALTGAQTVVHVAATTGKARPAVYERNNVQATRALLEASAAAGVARFVFISSIAAAFPDRRYYPYAESKIAAEAAVRHRR